MSTWLSPTKQLRLLSFCTTPLTCGRHENRPNRRLPPQIQRRSTPLSAASPPPIHTSIVLNSHETSLHDSIIPWGYGPPPLALPHWRVGGRQLTQQPNYPTDPMPLTPLFRLPAYLPTAVSPRTPRKHTHLISLGHEGRHRR